ncbi:MAG TPA: type VII secretion protein EccCa [Kineosporiaceae bacterium]|nr:type VII secretion protein EccCa [Kineosporiaceae bacterium]
MTAQLFHTQLRAPGPKLPSGDLALEPPPALPPPPKIGLMRLVMFLPMLLMPAGMILMAMSGGVGASSIGAGFMGMSMVGMMLPQMMRGPMDAQQGVDDDRSDYLRYLASERKKLREAVEKQRAALAWNNPDPQMLVYRTRTKRLWERQPSDDDFGEVRVGIGEQPCALNITPPEVIPLEELEPVSAHALRRLVQSYSTVSDLPMAISLPGFARIQMDGDPQLCRDLARALLGQLVTAHSPEFVRIALCTDADRQSQWDWVKWLPHGQHPSELDCAGSRRLFAATITDLERDVLADMITHRPRFEPHPTASAEDPFLVIIVDGAAIPPSSRLATSGYRGVVLLDVGGSLPWRQDRHALRLRVQENDLAMVVTQKNGEEMEELLGRPDTLALPQTTALARRLARWRVAGDGSSGSGDGGPANVRTVELADLLGIPDVHEFDAHEYWQAHGASGKLRVPLGVDENGTPVELDIRESAQGGMGPHGMLVGATGSGKSELLRTLVLAMAVRHSSEYLNFVLADFKGGATFVGLDRLPHTSALITNLAEELALVDRMQDAIHGELVRRQELLRATGYASLLEYERARAGGAPLAPLPTLFLVIDEFSELLTARRDFLNLFVMVGRLGRSLGVHLLLATQRLEEGRVHQLEGHLSYRIGLRMFSASESRSVLGITDAYESPLAPGQGFLKTSTATLIKFRGAYVSGQLKAAKPEKARASSGNILLQDLTSFSLPYLPLPEQPEPLDVEEPEEDEDEDYGTPADARENTVLHHLIERLTNSGPPAHRVWLPPMSEPPTLDVLFGGLTHDPQRGLIAASWSGPQLSVPVGIIDRPFEQRWDLLTVELEGASGHVGIVGGPQSGKSTLVRTLITALSLTNTPNQVRFYCLDFSGGGLITLGGLPHVGSVATRRDTDLVNRTLVELTELLDRREKLFGTLRLDSMSDARRLRDEGRAPAEDDFADVFLVVDGWFTAKQDFEHLEAFFQQLAQRGLNFGVHLVIASNRWSEFRMWLRDVLGTKLELHLNDPSDSAIGMRVAANVPNLPGRGLTADSMHFLAGLPRIDGITDKESLTQGTAHTVASIAAAWQGESAPSVRTLPSLIRFDELPEPEGGPTSKDDLRVPVGIDEHSGGAYWWDFGQHPHLVAFGDTETGKTTLLRLVLQAITRQYTPKQAKVVLGDFRRELYDTVPKESLIGYATNEKSLADILAEGVPALTDRIPADDLAVEALRRRDWWEGPRVFVVVDDLDLLTGGGFGSQSPLTALTPFIPQGADIGLHLVVTRATAQGSRGMADPAIRKVWDTGNPVLLFSCPREEGVIFGTTRPATLPPGRAQLITRRGSHLVQVGYVPDGPRADRS